MIDFQILIANEGRFPAIITSAYGQTWYGRPKQAQPNDSHEMIIIF